MVEGRRCEFDDVFLPLTPEGLEPACPECERDLQQHAKECWLCRTAPNLPEDMSSISLAVLAALDS